MPPITAGEMTERRGKHARANAEDEKRENVMANLVTFQISAFCI